MASAERERTGHLLTAIQQVEQAARDLLEKAGLAHIAGGPLRLDEDAAAIRRNDEAVAAAFAAAQLAYTDLRVALFRLARAFADHGRWEEVGQIALPLLDDEKAPLYTDARGLLCESLYRSASDALLKGEWSKSVDGFRRLAKISPRYRDTIEKLKELLSQVLENQDWDTGADVWVTLDGLGLVDGAMMQRVSGMPGLQKALDEKLTEVDLAWSTEIKTVVPVDYWSMITNRYAHNLTFSTGLDLLAVACYCEGERWYPTIYFGWVIVLSVQTGTAAHVLPMFEGKYGPYKPDPVQIGSIAFDENDRLLQVFMRTGNYIALDLSTGGVTTKDSGAMVPSKPIQSRLGQQVNPQSVSALKRELAKSASVLAALTISPDGKWIAAADQALTIYLFRRCAPLSELP